MNWLLPAILFQFTSLQAMLLQPTSLCSTALNPTILHSTPFNSTPVHSLHTILFHSYCDSTPLCPTPLHDLDHAQFGLEPCALTSPSASVKVCIYQALIDNCQDVDHLSCVQYSEHHFACIIPFNPHKALRCAYFCILLRQMRKLAYTMTKWQAPSHKTGV